MLITDEELIRERCVQLGKSRRGRNALKVILGWLDDDGLLLDFENREAITELLGLAWGGMAGTVRDEMRRIVES